MMVFDLACECGAQFEGWFQSHDDFAGQRKEGFLTCPVCGSGAIRKILSPVAIHTRCASGYAKSEPERLTKELAARALRKVQGYVEKNFEDVGPRFAEEAFKMHHGAKAMRNIRGVATPEEEKVLNKEGIVLLKIPLPPKGDKPH